MAVVGAFLIACAPTAACSGDDAQTPEATVSEGATAEAFVRDVFAAIEAVEAELGGPQRYFEVTANSAFTNVFVAVDDETAAVAYVFLDKTLQPPSPKQEGATGQTFTASDVDFDPDRVLAGVESELPTSTIDAISVYGNGFGAVYVLAATSSEGGFLDIEVGLEGDIRSVDPA
jgi:hypothetical protein